jgi:tyrosine-specific transport protein
MNRFLGAILLVSGMSIGTGMLALPVVTAFAGFFPTVLLLVVCWFFMLTTGLMFCDIALYTGVNSNIISMSEKTLKRTGKITSWICYLFLFYAIQAAHIAASVPLFSSWFSFLPSFILPLMLVIIFGGFIFAGTKYTDGINRFVFLGLVLGYLLLVLFAPKYFNLSYLNHSDFLPLLLNIPIVLTSFGFQNIVPTLCTYLNQDKKKIKLAIIIGSFIPVIFYVIWEMIVLGVVPLKGNPSLIQAYQNGLSGSVPLMEIVKAPFLKTGASLFTFSAILASFLGISLALIDFLIDGLKLPKTKKSRALAFLLAFIFPIGFVYLYPEGFLMALNLAGIIAIVLVGLLPCLMCFKLPKDHFWKSKKGLFWLIATLLFFSSIEILALLLKMGFFQSIVSPYLM